MLPNQIPFRKLKKKIVEADDEMDPVLVLLLTLIMAVGIAYLFLSKGKPTEEGSLATEAFQGAAPANQHGDSSGESESDGDVEGGAEREAAPRVAGGGGREAQRRARRLADQEERRIQRQGLLEGQRRKKEEDLEMEEKERAQEEHVKLLEEQTVRALRAEAHRKKEEEYNEWCGSISVEEKVEKGTDEEAQENLLEQLLTTIHREKVVVLHDLSKTILPSSTVSVERIVAGIEHLISTNQLSGVFDDRGKFVAITDDEYKQVSRFISQRGRVSMSELVRECNRVVGDNVATTASS